MLIELAGTHPIPFNFKQLDNPKLLNYARVHLENKGVLKLGELMPYCYLKISDDFIYRLFPLLENRDLIIPDYFNNEGSVGAHISVIYPEEMPQEMPQKILINELGNTFHFSVNGLYCVEIFDKKIIALIVECPDLQQLRLKYGFPIKLNYHGLKVPFHITIAIGY